MGTWSAALYGSDAANEIRDNIKELLRAPLDEYAIVAKLSEAYPNLKDQADEEYPDMWLALADQFHTHGVVAATAYATANAIIDSGLDLKTKRACGMVERDLKKRAKLLEELRAKWAKPHPKPVKRKVQETPDALIFDAGDCIVYPVTETGRTLIPDLATSEKDRDWKHFGYGAPAVLARGRYLDIFSWYGVARLSICGPEKPTLEACASAMIDSQTTVLRERLGEKPALCIDTSRLSPLQARKMHIETVGRLAPNEKTIREDLARVFRPGFTPGICLANELSGWGIRTPSKVPLSRYATAERV
ncbi:MAG: hypothetical protein ACT4O2_02535 [Beijerinckiaceae bacterium]